MCLHMCLAGLRAAELTVHPCLPATSIRWDMSPTHQTTFACLLPLQPTRGLPDVLLSLQR